MLIDRKIFASLHQKARRNLWVEFQRACQLEGNVIESKTSLKRYANNWSLRTVRRSTVRVDGGKKRRKKNIDFATASTESNKAGLVGEAEEKAEECGGHAGLSVDKKYARKHICALWLLRACTYSVNITNT